MPHYPSNYYDTGITSSYNNVVTRRLAIKDWVGFAPSQRFGGQQYEQKAVPLPYHGTIIDAIGATQQLLNELNLIAPLMPDLGIPVVLSTVGVATNLLLGANGVGVSYIGGLSTTIASTVTFDGVGIATGQRVLFYGLTTASLNGVYQVGFGTTSVGGPANFYSLQRSFDLTNWWQFAKPKTYLVTGGTVNKANVFSLQTDGWEQGNTFQIALGTSPIASTTTGTFGTSINMVQTNYTPLQASGINTTWGVGQGNTSLIYPAYNPNLVLNTGEYDFLSQDSLAEFIYLKNRAHRLAYRLFKMRENYSPWNSTLQSAQNNLVTAVGTANTANNIGVSSLNNLPSGSRYPSGFNRGF
jgi:hypothetical protein